MSADVSVFLIGPMGAGKSAVGRRLATMLKRSFYDTDAEIEQRTGVDIPFIFEKEGEAGFRRRERQVVVDLSKLQGIVLATGGGVVLDEANRSDLSAAGAVVYLHASVDQQLQRTRRGRGPPAAGDRRSASASGRSDEHPRTPVSRDGRRRGKYQWQKGNSGGRGDPALARG